MPGLELPAAVLDNLPDAFADGFDFGWIVGGDQAGEPHAEQFLALVAGEPTVGVVDVEQAAVAIGAQIAVERRFQDAAQRLVALAHGLFKAIFFGHVAERRRSRRRRC